MNVININGGAPLYGEMTVGGSKNAILPILAACILGKSMLRKGRKRGNVRMGIR